MYVSGNWTATFPWCHCIQKQTSSTWKDLIILKSTFGVGGQWVSPQTTRDWVQAPARGGTHGFPRFASSPSFDPFHISKLQAYCKHMPAKASRTKKDKVPRRGFTSPQLRELVLIKGGGAQSTLMLASVTKIGCGGMQEKAQLFLKFSCRLYKAEHHLPAATLNWITGKQVKARARLCFTAPLQLCLQQCIPAPTLYLLWVWGNTETHISWWGCKKLPSAHKGGWKPVVGYLPASLVALQPK